jgi:uncharacterized protein (TIGR02271 family)
MDRATRPEGNIADIQHGWEVYGSDEQKVGNFSEVQNNYIVAHKGFFFPKDLYIPFAAIERIEHDRVYLNVVKDDVDGQGWDTYPDDNTAATATGAGMMGAEGVRPQVPDAIGTPGLAGTTDEGGRPVRASSTAGTAGTTGATAGTTGWGTAERRTEATIPSAGTTEGDKLYLHEEQLQANKQREQTGEVRIGKEIVEEQQTINVPVTREEVYVERIPGDRQPDQHGIDASANETISVPVSEETVNVEKVPVMTEEVRVGKREVQENRQVTDTVKREQARVENDGNARVAGDDNATPDGRKI